MPFVLSSFILLGMLDSLLSVYALAVLLVIGRSLHDISMTAYLPRVCDEEELLTANALISSGWSAAMGFGAIGSGILITMYGVEVGLVIDSVTFLVAAIVISTLPPGGPDPDESRGQVCLTWSMTFSRAGDSYYRGRKLVAS